MAVLPLTPAPYPWESPYGYLLRLSEANGHTGIRVLIKQVESDPNYVVTVGWDYRKLALLLGPLQVLPDGFGYRARRYVRGRALLHDKPVSARHLGLTRARVCPHCIKDLGYIPAYWDLKAYVACHVHGCMMLKTCSSCGRRVKYFRNGIGKCGCGHDFRDEMTQAAPEELVAISEMLSVLVTGQGDLLVAHKLHWPVKDLLACGLDTFCRMLVALANVIVNMSKGRRRPNRLAEVSANLDKVGEIFTAWPLGFRRFAAEWNAYCLRRKQVPNVFQACYSWAFITLHKNLGRNRSRTNFLLRELLDYGYLHWSRKPIEVKERALKVTGVHRIYVGYKEAAELLGLPAYTVVRWLKNGRLPAKATGTKKRRPAWVIDLRELTKVRLSKFPGLGLRSAAKHLGVSNTVYAELLKANDIPKVYITDFESCASVEDLDEFSRSVLENVREVRSIEGMYSLASFMDINVAPTIKAQLLRDIRNHWVTACVHGKRNIRNVYLKEDPFLSSRAKEFSMEEDVLTVHRACLRHDLFFHEARAIFRHIEGDKRFKHMHPVATARVDDFMRMNMPLRRVASLISTETRYLLQAASKAGKFPAIYSLPAGPVGSKARANTRAWFMSAKTIKEARSLAKEVMSSMNA